MGLWLLLACLPLPAVAGPALVGAESPQAMLLVDSPWLRANMARDSLLVVDVRSAEAYAAGHIPGAINLPTQHTFNPVPPTDRMGPVRYIEHLLGSVGVGNDSNVVLYDGGEYIDAGRVFWILEVYGHRRVALLDGGLPGWKKRGFAVSREPVSLAPRVFVGAIQPDRLASRLMTRLAIENPDRVIVDARGEAEYLGLESRFGRRGHIPSAINVPAERNLVQVDGVPVLRSRAALIDLYRQVEPARHVITYCNRGRRSSFTYFVLRYLGWDVSHYDGSWFDWGNDDDLPVEK